MRRRAIAAAVLVAASFLVQCGRESKQGETAPAPEAASPGPGSPDASPAAALPEPTNEEPSCRTAAPEREPTDAWVAELQVRADATGDTEDVRKAMKAALLVLVEDEDDCWDVRDGFDGLCGTPGAPSVTIECQQWWDRAFKVRSEQRAAAEGE